MSHATVTPFDAHPAPGSAAFDALLAKTPRHSAQVSNFGPTPSQTVGPFFAYGLTAQQYGYDFGQPFTSAIAQAHAAGPHIRIQGQIFDGDGKPIPDAIVEFGHADVTGRYPANRADALAAGFAGFGRCGTGTHASNAYVFDTILPGAEAPGHAPCIHVCITMRGLLLHALSRLYFAGHPANAADPVLQAVPADRRQTLLATEAAPGVWQFNIHMQGEAETVFFDV